MARLYADENVSSVLIAQLRTLGHDVLTAMEAGQANAGIDDPAVLEFAVSQGRAVLTGNRHHFHRLHRQRADHEGIVTFKEDPDAAALARRVHDAIANLPALSRQLIRITRPN